MDRDIRETQIYKDCEQAFRCVLEPSFGTVGHVSGLHASPDGDVVACVGTVRETLDKWHTRVCLVNRRNNRLEVISTGPNDDTFPQWSPDGSRLAFLSDRREKGRFETYLLRADQIGEAMPITSVEGTAEYIQWSPDGTSILVGMAPIDADLAAVQGSGTAGNTAGDLPSWIPLVDRAPVSKVQSFRRLHRCEIATGLTRPVFPDALNVWEATWVGNGHIAGIVSNSYDENSWYSARVVLVDIESGDCWDLYKPDWQLGGISGSPDGRWVAMVTGLASDRGVMAGDLYVYDTHMSQLRHVETEAIDVTSLQWRSPSCLLFAGIRNLDTVVGQIDMNGGQAGELWATGESAGPFYPDISAGDRTGFFSLLEGFDRPPSVVFVHDNQVEVVVSFANSGTDAVVDEGGGVQEVRWNAPDGLEICGLLLTPNRPRPYPLVVCVHGGPVANSRNRWISAGYQRELLRRGYALLLANPRGSSGRGQQYAAMVYGDVGGAETADTLAGIDALIERGNVDRDRVGITGGSHGGYMTSWMITQSNRFRAAVPMHPVTNWFSQHGTSNIGTFDHLFLQDEMSNPGGRYFNRSPLFFAHRVQTPTLHVAGARDRCTPPTQAAEFHRALIEQGVESELVTYPEAGHGVRDLPALVDLTARVVEWFERHMPSSFEG